MGRRKTIDKNYIYELWDAGFTAKEIANKANCSTAAAYLVRYDKIGHIEPKTKNEMRKKIVVLYKNGMSQIEIARQLGISRQRVNQIVKEDTPELNLEIRKEKEKKMQDKRTMVVTDYRNGIATDEINSKYKLGGQLYKYLQDSSVATRREQGICTSANAKAIKVYDLGGNLIGEYPSIRSACSDLGIVNGAGNVSKYIRKGKDTIYGYKWEYK